MPPSGNRLGIPGPKSRRWGGVPHRWYGVSTWTPLANSEGSCPPPRGPDTNGESLGALLAQPTKGKEREVERE